MKTMRIQAIGWKFAWNGFRYVVKTQFNFRLQLSIAVITLLVAAFLKLSVIEWSLILLCIGTVLTLETVNTAIEVFVNMVQPEYAPTAGLIKDLSAAAVFISAGVSVVIGLIIFLPKVGSFCIAVSNFSF